MKQKKGKKKRREQETKSSTQAEVNGDRGMERNRIETRCSQIQKKYRQKER